MQCTLVVGNVVQVSAISFNFFELVVDWVVAISTSADSERFVVASENNFRLIVCVSARGYKRMTRNSFLRGGSRREPQVQVTMFGCEIAQRPNRNAIIQMRLIAMLG